MLAGFALVVWALAHNEYMSARIRTQGDRGQYVIASGPYAIVRHPNYAGGFLASLASGFVFGSWVAILPMLLHMGLLMYRTLQEEKVLAAELEGYADCARRVRWRFLPGVR
jgi:protein-S-isoprenylcysteine O-methyltransferase Ste14